MKNYSLTVNQNRTFEVTPQQVESIDMVLQNDGSYHLLYNNQSYHISILEQNIDDKFIKLLLNGKAFTIDIEDDFDLLVKKLGLEINTTQKIDEIKAPMPGLVLEMTVKVGQTITKGDPLLILEAMKMENVIKSAGDGVVKEILVKKGAAVEKGALLIKLE